MFFFGLLRCGYVDGDVLPNLLGNFRHFTECGCHVFGLSGGCFAFFGIFNLC